MVKVKIEEFECISPHHADMLKAKLQIELVDDFYKYSRAQIMSELRVDDQIADQWFDVLELFRIPKMTTRYAELLYYCNINSIEELAHREASRIFYKLQQLDLETYLIILQYPTFAEIDEWIYYAKLMINRIKYSGAVPLVLIPNFTVDRSSNLAGFGIYTVDDFLFRRKMIKSLRRKVLDMSRSEYKEFINFINILKIDGVDVYIAKLLWEAGYRELKQVKEVNSDELLRDIQRVQQLEENPIEIITATHIAEIAQNAVTMEEID